MAEQFIDGVQTQGDGNRLQFLDGSQVQFSLTTQVYALQAETSQPPRLPTMARPSRIPTLAVLPRV